MTDKTEEAKAPTASELAAAEREKINVIVSTKDDDAEETKEVEEGKEEAEATKDDVEEKKEEIEASEKTEDQLKEEKEAATTQAQKDKVQRKIDREVAKRKVLEEENRELKAKLAAVPDADKILTEEDVEKRAETKANMKQIENQFVKDCNDLAAAAKKTDPEFKKKIDAVTDAVEVIPAIMIVALADIDNGGAVLAYLANDEDEYERIVALKDNQTKLGRELQKLSDKIIAEAKPKIKEISKTPNPPEIVGGRGGTGAITLSDKDSTKDWIEKRERQLAEKRAIRH